jgi:oligopeptide/dipeptide ABC transporter ATP-binding protein
MTANTPSTTDNPATNTDQTDAPLLEYDDLDVTFETKRGDVEAVNGVSFALEAGEILCLVGESGSGKSVTAQSALDLVPQPPGVIDGEIRYRGQDIQSASEEAIRNLRGDDIGIIFQDPISSLNPVHTVGTQVIEALTAHGRWSGQKARERAVELMDRVGIPDAEARLGDYPFEFSGGMRQRVMIAIALANEPDVLIADEATTALDVTIEAQVLELIQELRDETGMGVVFITHDFGVVAEIADKVAVMYGGNVVERGDVFELFENPKHPYTEGLLGSIPGTAVQEGSNRLKAIDGEPPDMTDMPTGCKFYPRCPEAMDHCREEMPPTYVEDGEHQVRCFLHDDLPEAGDNGIGSRGGEE